MKKRKLNPDEMKMCVKSLKRIEGDKEWLDYQLQYYKLMLETGLEMNHRKNVRDFKRKNAEFKEELNIAKEGMKILKDQIRNGVIIREPKEDTKEEE